MEQVEVKITGLVITARYGTLSSGDVLRTDADYARHLVEDCAAAKYRKPVPAAQPEAASEPVALIKEPRQSRKDKQ